MHRQRPPSWTETPLDRDPTGQRPHWTDIPGQRPPGRFFTFETPGQIFYLCLLKISNLDVKQNFLSIIEWEFIFWLILQNCYGFSRFYHSDYRLNIYRSSTKLRYCFQSCLSVCLLAGWVLMDLFKLVHLRTPPALVLLPIWTPPRPHRTRPRQTCSNLFTWGHPPRTCSNLFPM